MRNLITVFPALYNILQSADALQTNGAQDFSALLFSFASTRACVIYIYIYIYIFEFSAERKLGHIKRQRNTLFKVTCFEIRHFVYYFAGSGGRCTWTKTNNADLGHSSGVTGSP